MKVSAPALDFPYGWGGPRDRKLGEALRERGPGNDHFGMIARSQLFLPKGKWKLAVLSDDGVRVRIGERTVLENWTWHGPTLDDAEFDQLEGGTVEVVVEHFEIDGYAVLRVELEPGSN